MNQNIKEQIEDLESQIWELESSLDSCILSKNIYESGYTCKFFTISNIFEDLYGIPLDAFREQYGEYFRSDPRYIKVEQKVNNDRELIYASLGGDRYRKVRDSCIVLNLELTNCYKKLIRLQQLI